MNFQLRYQKAVEAKQQRVGGRCNEKDGGISGVLGAGKRQVQGTLGRTLTFYFLSYLTDLQ